MPPKREQRVTVSVTVNGEPYEVDVEPRATLAELLREELGLTGTHVGCEQGTCGACTVLLDGASARSCLLFAAQADGCAVTTVEGLADPSAELHPIQRAFRDCHGLQCGFCTPGLLMTVYELLRDRRGVAEAEVREVVSGHLCRCTGYQGIVDAVLRADQAWTRPTS